MPSQATSLFGILRWLLAAAVVILLGLLRFGGDILIADDPVPPRVNAAIVLQGSIAAEKIRIAGAMNLLQRGVADKAVLSVPRESYWGQSIPPVARSYLERNYGVDLASRFEFCEMPGGLDSTLQEAEALSSCIRGYHWQSIVIVTSTYHTRRAGMLWRRITRHDPNLHVFVEGVADPEFRQPWWRHRQSAKIWVLESSKLVWTIFGG
jgi:uncharacterized SAM-binding protein YcdF (DUF218 family)